MCGITGIFQLNQNIETSILVGMTNSLRHRGPDDEGYLLADTHGGQHRPGHGAETLAAIKARTAPVDADFSANLGFGFRRLSILDLSEAGHQPMASGDGQLWIVFNGEIYNYLELRDELAGHGFHFRSGSDTEVILAAYQHWGRECLHRFNGMWAFVIYDATEKILFGSRDRFGVKPFYYWHAPSHFVFASEIKALLKNPQIPRRINPRQIFDYLVLGFEDLENEGFFEGIFELPPAHFFCLDLRRNKLDIQRYYRLEYLNRWEKFNPETFRHHVAEVRERICQAIALRLRADVPVGSCLSGGLDSSAIVCGIDALLPADKKQAVGLQQKVFTAAYENSPVDERKWAEMVVRQTNADWHLTFPDWPTLHRDLEDFIFTQEIPVGSTSMYAQYCVMRLARENGITVLLDGQGGDEIFSGYPLFYKAFYQEIWQNFDWTALRSELRHFDKTPASWRYLALSFCENMLTARLPKRGVEWWLRHTCPPFKTVINPDFWDRYQDRVMLFRDKMAGSLNEMMWRFMTRQNLKTLLKYEDRSAMRFSIESRTPFADDLPLIEYAFQMPASYKIHEGQSKYILRQAMRHVVPAEIVNRHDKIGFATPQKKWLNQMIENWSDHLTPGADNYLDVRGLRNYWGRAVDPRYDRQERFNWRVYNFLVWKKRYAV